MTPMRNLFLALVLANLGFAAWHEWYARRAEPRAHPTRSGASIQLVDEVGDGAGAAAAQSTEGAAAPGTGVAAPGSRTAGAAGDTGSTSAGASAGAAAADTAARLGPDGGRAPPHEPPAAASNVPPAPASNVASAAASDAAAAARTAAPPGGAPAKAPGPAKAIGNRCISVGPFRELAQAATASAKLREAGFEPSQRSGEGDVWLGYWVYLDQLASKDTEAMLAKLHANRVPEAYLIPGDDGGTISLGVFNEMTRAGRLRDQVRALGFEPVVVDRTRHEDVYWVDVKLPAGQQLDLGGLETAGPPDRLEQRSCSETGGKD